MVTETFDLGDRKAKVEISREEDTSDLSSEEMEEWIEYTLRMREESLNFRELFNFLDNEEGINNVTRFTVSLERMQKDGRLMVSEGDETTEIIFLG